MLTVPTDSRPRISKAVIAHAPHCRYHQTTRMHLVPADVPFFGLCANARCEKDVHTGRLIWRCPKKNCPWVAAAESESGIAEWKRSEISRVHYSECLA